MNKTIWKFPLPINDDISVYMPRGAHVIAVQPQNGVYCVWAIVDPENSMESRQFFWRGTGHPMPDIPVRHIGTVQQMGGALIFHLFEPSFHTVETCR